jgi:hypothetical protein
MFRKVAVALVAAASFDFYWPDGKHALAVLAVGRLCCIVPRIAQKPGDDRVEDRRQALRRRILKSGTIILANAKVPCAVRDLSTIGACLVVPTTFGIPGTFKFVTYQIGHRKIAK